MQAKSICYNWLRIVPSSTEAARRFRYLFSLHTASHKARGGPGCTREAAQVGPPLGDTPWRHASDDNVKQGRRTCWSRAADGPRRPLPPVTEVAADLI